MKEKYDEANKTGWNPQSPYFGQLWTPCNIYNPNSGCKHDGDKKACCATPDVEGDAAPGRILPWDAMDAGDGLCIPTDADTTDGKLATEAYQYCNSALPDAGCSSNEFDTHWQDEPNGQPLTPKAKRL